MKLHWLRNLIPAHNLPLMAAVFFLLGYAVAPSFFDALSLPLLGLGMIFPGIPHGALDHRLAQKVIMPRFVLQYLGIMVLVVFIWYVSPITGLLTFLAYSAWHFCETDTRQWVIYTPFRAWLQGSLLLTFILLSHPLELLTYLKLLGIPGVSLNQQLCQIITIASAVLLLFPAWFMPASLKPAWVKTLLVLYLGVFIPLIPAFGLYFIAVHSATGWGHISKKLSLNSWQLLQLAMPFSLGAFALFIVLIAVDHWLGLSFDGLIPGMFVFLAAISAPHIWFMHRFYERLP